MCYMMVVALLSGGDVMGEWVWLEWVVCSGCGKVC